MSTAQSKIGVQVDDFQVGAKAGLDLASKLGFRLVEIGATAGTMSPKELSFSGRRHVKRYVSSLGLSIAALRTSLTGEEFLDHCDSEQRLEQTKEILELAADLNVPTVTTPIGRFDANNSEQYAMVREVLHQVAEHADKVGRFVALESIVDPPTILNQLLRELNCSYLKLSYDPGLLLMEGFDPLAPIEILADHIAISHPRDATLGSRRRPGRETNLGEGQLNLHDYLAYLEQAGYRGGQIVRRAHSDNPISDMQACKSYLESILE